MSKLLENTHNIIKDLEERGILLHIDSIDYPKELFISMGTNTVLDPLFSNDNPFHKGGGVPKATNWMLYGDPGAGKTTVGLDIVASIAKHDSTKEPLFISGEMSKSDMFLYCLRYPKFGKFKTLFLGELEEEEIIPSIEAIFKYGYDIVLIDSFIEVQEAIREGAYVISNKDKRNQMMSAKGSEQWLLKQMKKHNRGENDRKVWSTFIFIEQVTKGGVFVGSNKKKHLTTGTIRVSFDDPDSQEDRYIYFNKNRRGDVGIKLYFDLDSIGDVVYNIDKFNKDKEQRERNKMRRMNMKKSELDFKKAFGIAKTDEHGNLIDKDGKILLEAEAIPEDITPEKAIQ